MPAPYSIELRERVVRARLVAGLRVEEVAALFDVGTATVKRWTAAVRSGRGLVPLESPGRPREFTEEHDAYLAELVALTPDASLGELADGIADRYHRTFDAETVRRGLQRLGLSRKKNGVRGRTK
jgi:transposase